MLKRLLSLLVFVPIGIVLIAVAVSNRQDIVISVPPFTGDIPFYSVTIPLFVMMFAVLLVGMCLGSVVTWFRQSSYRRQARSGKSEIAGLTKEIQSQKDRIAELQEAAIASADTAPAQTDQLRKIA